MFDHGLVEAANHLLLLVSLGEAGKHDRLAGLGLVMLYVQFGYSDEAVGQKKELVRVPVVWYAG